MIVAIIIGAITGWLLAIPIGPLNATVISRSLKYGYKHGLAAGFGGALMDVIYCGGAAQINQFLVASPIINLLFELVGLVALVWLGVRQLRVKSVPVDRIPPPEGPAIKSDHLAQAAMKRMHIERKSLAGPFVLGVVLYATNVMAVPEWIIISGLWRSWGLLKAGVDINAIFALGAGLGTAAWYVLLVRWISKRHRGFKPSTLRKVDLVMGVAMLVFGAYFAYAILFETNWNSVQVHFRQDTNQVLDSVK